MNQEKSFFAMKKMMDIVEMEVTLKFATTNSFVGRFNHAMVS